ncbi:uncharacterized protein MONBRDRAFT_25576 [Monosiga brevicollis MX1]|uniref:Uncharacterized protein n=1 Tax=Monosiga brevicollis TaxID=81824 RepID=A9UZT9_MONBE|nr:uncharacterized protein MONBRDRAFT_25576 [Monosiga brevicollis MX1]EDQ89293.1 predicted protein [Monosiga brevicollis MX1]|eukprot:XP_001745869.1 hypothetical protein [Monosiga brevicollis MX1]
MALPMDACLPTDLLDSAVLRDLMNDSGPLIDLPHTSSNQSTPEPDLLQAALNANHDDLALFDTSPTMPEPLALRLPSTSHHQVHAQPSGLALASPSAGLLPLTPRQSLRGLEHLWSALNTPVLTTPVSLNGNGKFWAEPGTPTSATPPGPANAGSNAFTYPSTMPAAETHNLPGLSGLSDSRPLRCTNQPDPLMPLLDLAPAPKRCKAEPINMDMRFASPASRPAKPSVPLNWSPALPNEMEAAQLTPERFLELVQWLLVTRQPRCSPRPKLALILLTFSCVLALPSTVKGFCGQHSCSSLLFALVYMIFGGGSSSSTPRSPPTRISIASAEVALETEHRLEMLRFAMYQITGTTVNPQLTSLYDLCEETAAPKSPAITHNFASHLLTTTTPLRNDSKALSATEARSQPRAAGNRARRPDRAAGLQTVYASALGRRRRLRREASGGDRENKNSPAGGESDTLASQETPASNSASQRVAPQTSSPHRASRPDLSASAAVTPPRNESHKLLALPPQPELAAMSLHSLCHDLVGRMATMNGRSVSACAAVLVTMVPAAFDERTYMLCVRNHHARNARAEDLSIEAYIRNFVSSPLRFGTPGVRLSGSGRVPQGSYHMMYARQGRLLAVRVVDVVGDQWIRGPIFADPRLAPLNWDRLSLVYELLLCQRLGLSALVM